MRNLNTDTEQIPKIIHHVWVGSDTVKQSYSDIAETWKKYHPTWDYRLWTAKQYNALDLSNETISVLENIEVNKVIKTNLLRYEILYRFGGIYSDMDVECLKPFDPLFESNKFICGLESDPPGPDIVTPEDIEQFNLIGSALVACCPGHKAMQEMITHIQMKIKSKIPTSIREHLSVGGPIVLTGILRKYSDIIPFPKEYFYPTNWKEIDKLKEDHPNSYSKHWWKSQEDGGWIRDYAKWI
jgi:inositol phosphorylceramide mannosyltransferase catalytic subunit